MITYEENEDVAYVDGYRFRRDKRTGYYLSSCKIGDKRVRLHVYVWTKYNGEIPSGYNVHHIDENKYNNEIDNLKLMLQKDHLSLHSCENYIYNKECILNTLINKAVPASKEWHASEEGREWHKSHYDNMKDMLYVKRIFKCIQCGESFSTSDNGRNRFCSNSCKSAYRRESGIDNEERSCEICGNKYIIGKYIKKRTCSRECSAKLRKNTIYNLCREI